MNTKTDFYAQMKFLGVNPGDTLLLRADLSEIYKPHFFLKKREYLDLFLNYLGDSGTLVALAFNPIIRGRDLPTYDIATIPYTGSLSKLMVKDSRAIRSEHPLESFVAIGKNASFLMSGHSLETASFFPIEKMIAVDAKMLVVGCLNNSPGFTTVHYVQHKLGLSKKVLCVDSDKAFYLDSLGNRRTYVSKEIGGCSRGFDKFYPLYLQAGVLRAGFLGNAYSLGITMKDAVYLESEILTKNERFFCCDNKDCWFCGKRYLPNLSIGRRFFLYIQRKLVCN